MNEQQSEFDKLMDKYPLLAKHFKTLVSPRDLPKIDDPEKVYKSFNIYGIPKEYHEMFLYVVRACLRVSENLYLLDKDPKAVFDEQVEIYRFFKEYRDKKLNLESFTIKASEKGENKDLKIKTHFWLTNLTDELLERAENSFYLDEYDFIIENRDNLSPDPTTPGRRFYPNYVKYLAKSIINLIDDLNLYETQSQRDEITSKILSELDLVSKKVEDPSDQMRRLLGDQYPKRP